MAAAELRVCGPVLGGCVFVDCPHPPSHGCCASLPVCFPLPPLPPQTPLGEPLFQGKGELDQIKKIFALLGTPSQVNAVPPPLLPQLPTTHVVPHSVCNHVPDTKTRAVRSGLS